MTRESMMEMLLRQMAEGKLSDHVFMFNVGANMGSSKTYMHPIDPDRADFGGRIFAGHVYVFTPAQCKVDHLKSCNVANGFEVVYPQLQ